MALLGFGKEKPPEEPRAAAAFAEAERRIAKAKREKEASLDLSILGLAQLPESIGQLAQLRVLDLRVNQLTELPKSIGKLARLEWLYLNGNRLTQLPESIRRLAQLNTLHLEDNRLTQLPESIGQLAQLREFHLDRNQLTQLPESIGQLAQLQSLHLRGNRLTQLPKSVGQLARLRWLFLGDNRLTQLPESLRQMTVLAVLVLHDNPALNIPPEELGPTWSEARGRPKPPREILDYYFRTLALAKRPLNEAKLILVGRGGAGKTSLRKRLLTGEWDEHEDKTPGIAVTPWPLTLAAEQVKLNVWDFGGQEIMHATHQFFLTRRSLYVLVLNAREGEQDANVEYWLRLVAGYGGGSPALVVLNKCDQHPLDLDERGLREKFPFIRGFLRTDCKTQHGLGELRAAIERETTSLPDLRTPFPEVWFGLKKKLAELPGDCITYDEYRRLCVAEKETDAGNQELLIGFLHDLGTVLHFRDDYRLNHLGVLKPEWVTQGIYGLLNADELKAAGGVLGVARLDALLDARRYPPERHGFLLQLMEKFELCFELPGTRRDRFLIPELLPKETPELAEWKEAEALRFEYHYNILPEGLLPRFIVRTHALSDGQRRWRSGVVLRQGDALALVRADVQERLVTITVRGPGRQPRELLAMARGHFEEIHRGISGLAAGEKVPVPGCPDAKPLDYRELLVLEADGETEVKVVAAGRVVKLPLGKLLDNFEAKASREERVQYIKVEAGGHLHMPEQQQNINVGRDLTGNVGINQTFANCYNTAAAVEQPELAQALKGLIAEAEKAAPQLGEGDRVKLEKRLKTLTDAAKEPAPDKEEVQFSAKGIIEAASIFPPVIAATKAVLGFFGITTP